MWSKNKSSALIIDLLILGFLGIWIVGGVPWNHHVYLSHGADSRRAAIIIALFTYYRIPASRETSLFLRAGARFWSLLQTSSFRWCVYGVFSLMAVIAAVLQALAMDVTLYDVGIFHQILWNLNQGFGFQSTISGAGNFLQDHLSPSLALLVPLFRASGESPLFLPIVQAVLLYGGAAAWVYLAERLPKGSELARQQIAGAVVLLIFSFDSLWGNLKWGFHENAIGFCAVSWALALLTLGPTRIWRSALILVLLMITAASKEILLLQIAAVLTYWVVVEWRQTRKVLGPGLLTSLAFSLVGVFVAFEKSFHPVDKNYFDRYYSYLGQNLADFTANLFQHPFLVPDTVGYARVLKYFIDILAPWLFLPVLIPVLILALPKFRARLADVLSPYAALAIVVAPSFLSAALATYPPLRNVRYHYALELWPAFAVGTVLVLGSLTAHLEKLRFKRLIVLWVGVSLLRMDSDPLADVRHWVRSLDDARPVREYLQNIPTDVAITADEMAGPWIAGRPYVMRWPETALLPSHNPNLVVLRFVDSGTALGAEVERRFSGATMQWQNGVWKVFKTN